MKIPKRPSGRKTAANEAAADEVERAFAAELETVVEESGFTFGARGWCYYIEGKKLITKADFPAFEALIGRLRKSGVLNPDIVADDGNREADGGEGALDRRTPEQFATYWMDLAEYQMSVYTPTSFWEGLDTYVEVAVEKKDLIQLFSPVLEPFGIPITNFKGDPDINSRRAMLKRMREHYEDGRRTVLLYWGDHDPKGLQISDNLNKLLADCENIQDVQWGADNVEVVRCGLSREQIDRMGLVWIDNLQTSAIGKKALPLDNPKHRDHEKPYVQSYLRDHGSRKVEANALVGHWRDAQCLMRDAVGHYIPLDWPERHAARLEPQREQARHAMRELLER